MNDHRGGSLRRLVETAAAVAVMPLSPLLRPWHLGWGATAAEVAGEMAGDELVPRAHFCATRAITIAAPPEEVWPWITQTGFGRGGFSSYDLLDNLGRPSAAIIDRRWSHPQVGDIAAPMTSRPTPATAFTVHRAVEPQLLVWTKPDSTWAWRLTPIDAGHTRLVTRLKVRYPRSPRALGTIVLMELGDFVMMRRMLRTLRERAAGNSGPPTAADEIGPQGTSVGSRFRRARWREHVRAVGGVAVMLAAFATPMLRRARRTWGLPPDQRTRAFPGDDLVARPRWEWVHAIEIEASTDEVWPWVAQIGADRAGFYSYETLENLAGCRLSNADRIYTDWAVQPGGLLSIHPKMPPLPVTAIEPGHWFVVHASPAAGRAPAAKGEVAVSWLFLVEPIDDRRTRVISRYRCATAPDLATRLQFGPTFIEPISFAMDRAMLLGIKSRARR